MGQQAGTDSAPRKARTAPRAERRRGAARGLYAQERQSALALLARSEGRVSVVEAAAAFEVTPETIRRDLEQLDRAGVIQRVHGGAIPAEHGQLGDRAVSDRESSAAAEKDRIAHAALSYLPTTIHGSILLDAGTTTGRLARALPVEADLAVFTSCPLIAAVVAERAQRDVELSGGRVRGLTQACVGAETVAWFERLRVDVAFIATNGVSFTHGLSTPDLAEASVKRAMVRCANKVVLLADSRKLGVETACSFARLDDIDVLITDSALADAFRRRLTDFGIEVVTA